MLGAPGTISRLSSQPVACQKSLSALGYGPVGVVVPGDRERDGQKKSFCSLEQQTDCL